MSERIKDLEKDLEATRQWAIAAENELSQERETVEQAGLEIDKLAKELKEANLIIKHLTEERDALYASFD